MKLKLIVTVNFQRTEAENFKAAMKKHPDLVLGPDDVVCMISMARDQIVFMHRLKEIDVSQYGRRRGTANMYHSERLRIDRSTFAPAMLQNYANDAGITLDGFRRFEDIYPNLAEKENIIAVPARRKASAGKVIQLRKAA